MSKGYVTTNIPRVPDKVRPKGQPKSVNLSAVNPSLKFSVDDYLFSNPLTSFRSGPSFERESRKPGAIFGEQTLGEFLAGENGDIGHRFSMKKVTEYYGRTFSKRPDVSMSPLYGVVGNPIPASISLPSGPGTGLPGGWLSDQVVFGSSPGYGFARTDSDLVTIGTSFIKATNPIQSQVNLLSDIAEAFSAKELIPALLGKQIVGSVVDKRKRRDLIRSTGGEYLNYIFGYKPLADDIAKVGVLIDTVNSIIDQWIKDSGTIVRRRRKVPGEWHVAEERTIPPDTTLANSAVQFVVPGRFHGKTDPQPWNCIGNSSTASNNAVIQGFGVRRVNSQLTFSAGYEYDLSRMFLSVEGGSAAELMTSAALKHELLQIAFGLDAASIATAVYDATPFSWLLDWFVDVGDVIDNFRGLTARGVQMVWGYVTETVTRETYQEFVLTWKPSGQVFFRSNGLCTQKVINRVRATPFGFGVSFDSLTEDQNTTLAALGAAKSPTKRR